MFFFKRILNMFKHRNHTKLKKVCRFPSNHCSFVCIAFFMVMNNDFCILWQPPPKSHGDLITNCTWGTHFMKPLFDGPPSSFKCINYFPFSIMFWIVITLLMSKRSFKLCISLRFWGFFCVWIFILWKKLILWKLQKEIFTKRY